jgi:DNA invertase Pin-like site-specific DNA recombinase
VVPNIAPSMGYAGTDPAVCDCNKRQRAAREAYAKANGYTIADDDSFYDTSVKGSDAVTERPGFTAMLDASPQRRAHHHCGEP